MKQTVGTLLSMTNYLAKLAEIRAVLRAMIVTTMSAYHRQKDTVVRFNSFTNRYSLQIVLRGLANPPGSVDVIPTAGCAPLLDVHSALGALFWGSYVRARLVLSSDVRACVTGCVRVYGLQVSSRSYVRFAFI